MTHGISLAISALGLSLFSLALQAAPPGVTPRPPVDQLPVVKDLPDPFLLADGSRVKTPDDWNKRRAELKALVQYYEYGHLPPAPGNVQGKELCSISLTELNAVNKQILLTMGPDEKISTHVELYVPDGKGPFPVIINGDLGWGKPKPPVIESVLRRGYILAYFNREEICPDKNDHAQGVWAAYPEYDCGASAAWAWGFHRVVDYLITLPNVDKNHIAVTGHSRGGKAVLLAGAMDERIALTAPNNSGCGGAGCYRFQAAKSEDIAAILKNFPFWFQPDFKQFIGKVDRLPIDQHSVKALVAPRALLSTEALGDLWANPEGTQQTHLAAKQVYDFLGVPQKIGIYYRQGKHEQNPQDWQVLLDFADLQFFGKKTERKFDQLAFPDSPKSFSWTAPAK